MLEAYPNKGLFSLTIRCAVFLVIEEITSENFMEGNVTDLPDKWSALFESD